MGAALSSVLEKQLVPSTQALLQPQQLIHSSQLILKLHVRARSEETKYQLPWKTLSFQTCSFTTLPTMKWLPDHISERATLQSVLTLSLLSCSTAWLPSHLRHVLTEDMPQPHISPFLFRDQTTTLAVLASGHFTIQTL